MIGLASNSAKYLKLRRRVDPAHSEMHVRLTGDGTFRINIYGRLDSYECEMNDYVNLSIIFLFAAAGLVGASLLMIGTYKLWNKIRNHSARKKSFSELMQ